MLAPAVEWATAHGPPNWLFAVALLTTPHQWSRYANRAIRQLYKRYTGDTA